MAIPFIKLYEIKLYGIATCPWQWFMINYFKNLEFANESLKYVHRVMCFTRDMDTLFFPFHWIRQLRRETKKK